MKFGLSDKNLVMSRSVQQSDETIFSSGVSCFTVPDKLIELVQYLIRPSRVTMGLARDFWPRI